MATKSKLLRTKVEAGECATMRFKVTQGDGTATLLGEL